MHVSCSLLPTCVDGHIFTIGPSVLSSDCILISLSFAGFHFDTEDGDKVLPGFLDSISGIQRGETKSFRLTFPESWRQEHLRGVQAQFTVSFFLFYRV